MKFYLDFFFQGQNFDPSTPDGLVALVVFLLAILLLVALLFLIRSRLRKKKLEIEKDSAISAPPEEAVKEETIAQKAAEKKGTEEKISERPKGEISFFTRLTQGLTKSRQEVWGKLGNLFSQENPDFDEVEEILYSADIPTSLVQELVSELETKARGKTSTEIHEIVYAFLYHKMDSVQLGAEEDRFHFTPSQSSEKVSPKVYMVVGVNGAGKTTTIGKLSTKLKAQGAKVIVGACDTFRAAAVDQLQVWCDRAGVDMVRAKDGADPSGVAYDTVAKAYNEGYDYCIIDTAGRLHTNQNLMDELSKTKRVMSKINDQAPHEVILVLDAITGQNAMKQAQEFNKALNLTGLIFTKCDGSAKAGGAVGIVDLLKIPILYIGVGESVDDLLPFNLSSYLKGLIGIAE